MVCCHHVGSLSEKALPRKDRANEQQDGKLTAHRNLELLKQVRYLAPEWEKPKTINIFYTCTFKEVCAPTINSILVLAPEVTELSSLDSPHLILSCSPCLSHPTPCCDSMPADAIDQPRKCPSVAQTVFPNPGLRQWKMSP